MTADLLRDVVAGVLLLAGGVLALGAGIGLLRFPDLLSRQHTATKPQTLGLICVLLGLAVRLGGVPTVWMLILVVLFQLLTSPVGAHMVARAGYRTGKVLPEHLVVDELTRDLEAAEAELAARRQAATSSSVTPPDAGPDSDRGGLDQDEAAVEEAVAREAHARAEEAEAAARAEEEAAAGEADAHEAEGRGGPEA